MPVEVKPLFRPDILWPRINAAILPDLEAIRPILTEWSELLWSDGADKLKEQQYLPRFLNDVFGRVLGYSERIGNPERFTMIREELVAVDGKYADAALGEFSPDGRRYVVAVEGKGPADPLDRPFKSRKMSAVDQGYRYAINLQCDWIIVTSMRETRLYYKGADQFTFERFVVRDLVENDALLKKFLFLLSADRVVPAVGSSHLEDLRAASEKVGRDLTKDYYLKYAEIREDVFEQLCLHNPEVRRHDVLAVTQKVLDRVLFCAFCEDRGLLPDESLKNAFEHQDPYAERPIWDNFRGLFRSIDKGNDGLKIPAYNGGLFAADAILDSLSVPDAVCRHFKNLGDYEYRPAGDVAEQVIRDDARTIIDVDILGHIFEQSISDLEHLRNELDGLVPVAGKEKHKTRRKKDGAFYTPAFITRYIVEQTLGGVLTDRFEQLRKTHWSMARGTARKTLDDPRVYDADALNAPQTKALTHFWEAWQDELKTIRILDPAVGSGAFLIEAFDQLHAVYEESNERLEEVRGYASLFDLDREILQNNLYGVDINEEAVQICRLSLWIKTAARGKQLTSLDHNIRVGNSVVDDVEVHPQAFDWCKAFPEVSEAGGFDVIIANPPYIRQEWLVSFKAHWKKRFQSFQSSADIYVYFFELGINLLRMNGRLGFITSGSWAFSGFGAELRSFVIRSVAIESLIDFGEFQPFEAAEMIRPTIVVFRAADARKPMRLYKWLTAGDPPENLSEIIASAPTLSTSHLDEHAWELEPDAVRALKRKMMSNWPKLASNGRRIFAGIKTGRNEAFIIDEATKQRLCEENETSAEIIHPYLMGTDVQNWKVLDRRRYLIFSKQGIDIESYPAVHAYLQQFRDRLTPKPEGWQPSGSGERWIGRKGGDYAWYEIQDASDFFEHFRGPKVIWPDIAKLPRFALDESGAFLDMTCFMLPDASAFHLGLLNSWATWFLISKSCQPLRLRGKRWQYRLKKQWICDLPVPSASNSEAARIGELAMQAQGYGNQIEALKDQVRRRAVTAFRRSEPDGPSRKLNRKASEWWNLSIMQFGESLSKSLGLEVNPFTNPATADVWDPYLVTKKREIGSLSTKLCDAEEELNQLVNRLFDLNPDDIKLLKEQVAH